jgi:hypothetical protein
MRNPRIAVEEAVRRARAVGIEVGLSKDHHWLFYLPRGIVSVAGGRREMVPPILSVAIRREEAKLSTSSSKLDGT